MCVFWPSWASQIFHKEVLVWNINVLYPWRSWNLVFDRYSFLPKTSNEKERAEALSIGPLVIKKSEEEQRRRRKEKRILQSPEQQSTFQ